MLESLENLGYQYSMKQVPEQNGGGQNDSVRLPVLFGIRPGVYLAALYTTLTVLALFFIFLYPGIANPGSELVITSEPSGAAVRVDDVYFAAAPARIFVPKGSHVITAVMEGFEPDETKIDFKSRVFASRFFPKKVKLDVKLKENSSCSALIAGARDFAAWSFAEAPTENWQIPLFLSEGVYRSAPKDDEARSKAAELIAAASRFMTNGAAAKDLIRAEFIAAACGNAPSPLAALSAVREVFTFLRQNPAFIVAIGDIAGDNAAKTLIESKIYPNLWQESDKEPRSLQIYYQNGAEFSLEGIRFSRFFEETRAFQLGGESLWFEDINRFAIAKENVSANVWARFLAENTEWQIKNRAALIEKGLVSADYLEPAASFVSPEAFFAASPVFPAPAQPGLSWHAAMAFCRWLNTKLPASLAAEYEVRLPSEAEWEYAAKAYEQAGLGAGFSGRLWNWCLDDYAPLASVHAPKSAIASISSPERPVRGGSWMNPAGSVFAEMRASLPPNTCSPYAGFKPVVAKRIKSEK